MACARAGRHAALSLLLLRHNSSTYSTLPCSPSCSKALIKDRAASRKPCSPRALPVTSTSTTGSRKAAFEPVPGGRRLFCATFSHVREPCLYTIWSRHTKSLAIICPNLFPSVLRCRPLDRCSTVSFIIGQSYVGVVQSTHPCASFGGRRAIGLVAVSWMRCLLFRHQTAEGKINRFSGEALNTAGMTACNKP